MGIDISEAMAQVAPVEFEKYQEQRKDSEAWHELQQCIRQLKHETMMRDFQLGYNLNDDAVKSNQRRMVLKARIKTLEGYLS